MPNKKRVFLGIEQHFEGPGFIVTGCDDNHGLEYQDFIRLVHFLRDRLPHTKYGENQTTVFEDANDLFSEIGKGVEHLFSRRDYEIFVRPLGARK